eukprot:2330391-Pyramimonas_sp.AAC.1
MLQFDLRTPPPTPLKPSCFRRVETSLAHLNCQFRAPPANPAERGIGHASMNVGFYCCVPRLGNGGS